MLTRLLLPAAGAFLFAACGSTAKVAQTTPPPPSAAPPLEHRPIEAAKDPAGADQPVAEDSHVGDGPAAPGEPIEAAAAPAAPSAQEAASDRKGEPIGEVAGVPIYAEDLLSEWHQIAGREVFLVIDKVVTTRLAIAEAQRIGMRLAPEAVETRLAMERVRLEQTVENYSPGTPVDDYLRGELGVEPGRYYQRMRAATIRQMLAERVVRAWTLSNENVALRLIVSDDEAKMADLEAQLANGADFGDLAREHSIDDTASLGGYVPYLVRQEHSPLARLAFATAVGELGGPLPTADSYFLIRVEERRGPIAGDWNSIEAAVEESLDTHGLSDAEFVHWKVAMEARYPIDMRRLEEILGTEG